MQIVNNIFYDDDKYVYLDTTNSGWLKLAKDLQSDPIVVDSNEAESITTSLLASSGATIAPFDGQEDSQIERIGNIVQYKGVRLLDLEALKSLQKEPIGLAAELGNGMDLVVIGVYKDDVNIEKWWTLRPEFHSFVVKDRTVQQVPGFTQQPTRFIQSPDGSVWLISDADKGTPRPNNYRSQLALIGANGEVHSLNAEFDAFDMNIVSLQHNKLIVKAFNNRTSPNLVKDKDGFYSVDTKLQTTKLSDLSAHSAYEDRDGHVYVVNPGNQIMEVSSNRTWQKFDYALIELFNARLAPNAE